MASEEAKIKILKNGPYAVTGNLDISVKIIEPAGNSYKWKDGENIAHGNAYTLCRCGGSKKHPFCDGSHIKINFDGTETASMDLYKDRAEQINGAEVNMLDDNRCALARFCHREKGDAWELAGCKGQDNASETIKAASECPSGRLTAVTKEGKEIEPELDQSIAIIQDPEMGVSGGIYVKGGVRLQSADGDEYETRNRIVLCRCGKSKDKPFCDGSHIEEKFRDGSDVIKNRKL